VRGLARRLIDRLDRWQRRHPVAGFPVAVMRTFSDDRGGRHVARIAYYSFFSLFPLLLAAVTILAYVVDDPRTRQDLAEGALGQVPLIGSELADSSGLTGNPAALVVGLVAAVWAALAAMQAAQDGLNDVWGVSRLEQPGFLWKRLRSLGALVALSTSVAVSSAVTQLATLVPGLSVFARVGAVAGSLAVNVVAYLVGYVSLSARRLGWRAHLPGAVFGGAGFLLVQVVGQYYVRTTVQGAQDTYGTFAVVIGLLTWLSLLAWVALLGAEINVVAAERLWPRALTNALDPSDADRRVFGRLVAAQRLRDDQHVDVVYAPPIDPRAPEPDR
jgi:YihY family inner membrane protein